MCMDSDIDCDRLLYRHGVVVRENTRLRAQLELAQQEVVRVKAQCAAAGLDLAAATERLRLACGGGK